MATGKPDKLTAALHYAGLGYAVFPCVPDGKAPATAHGCKDATTDTDQINKWWSENPQYNVAIATEGLLVVDVDPGGGQWLQDIDDRELLATCITATPRKGRHYWFRQNGTALGNTAGKLHAGVDTRANGGYVLVPPSTVGGRGYSWVAELAGQLPSPPAWLVERLAERQPARESLTEQIPEGSRNQVMIKHAGYLRRGGLTREEIYEALRIVNRHRCRPPLPDAELERVAANAARYEPDFVTEALLQDHFPGGEDEDEQQPPQVDVEFPAECLSRMPGVMREAYDWVMDCSILPQPQLTLGALIALFGAAFGRKVEDDYGTRTNVMVMGLAPSGAGKDHQRKCNKLLMASSGMAAVNASERIGSHAGIVTAVDKHPVRLFQIDELGRMLATMKDPRASHLWNIATVLMQLYSSSNTVWTGDAYADINKVKTIDQPHVCVYGTSVPESLYHGLTPDNLTDGLVGRLLLFQSEGHPQRRKPIRGGLPWRVTETLRMWFEFQPPGTGNLGTGTPIMASKTPAADQRHEEYCDVVNAKHREEDNVRASVWSRAPEKAAKLALIYACCMANEFDVTIDLDAVQWGIRLANYSTRLVLQASDQAVAGSQYEADLKYVFAEIPKRGEVSQRELTRRTRRLKQRARTEIIADLLSSGAINTKTVETGARPKTVFWRLRNTP